MSAPRLGPGRRIPYGIAIGPLLLLALWVIVPLPIGYWLFRRTDFR